MTDFEHATDSADTSRKITRPPSRIALKLLDGNIPIISAHSYTSKEPKHPKQSEYAEDICHNLRVAEKSLTPCAEYMKLQPDINYKMRAILIDWLVTVHAKFRLCTETLFLCINLVDRYLEKRAVSRNILQLLGVAAMLIASKYEEIYPPEIRDFIYITDKAYTKQQLLRMESDILNVLEFRVCVPTAWRFLERFSSQLGLDDTGFALARYCIELCLLEYHMLRYLPSELAACSVYLATKILNREHNTLNLVARITKHDEERVRACARDMLVLFQAAPKHTLMAVREKFASSTFFSVSSIRLM
jgi:hypothetical protein